MTQKINEVGKVPFESTTTTGATGDPNVAAATALTGVVNENFITIRDWIRSFLQSPSEVRVSLLFSIIVPIRNKQIVLYYSQECLPKHA